jgi:preprotein translocase subunit SecY
MYLPALRRSSTPIGGLGAWVTESSCAATIPSTWDVTSRMIVFFTYFYVSITFNPTRWRTT